MAVALADLQPITAEAYARFIEHLLGRHGLVVFESADPAAKPLARDIFANELRNPGRSSQLATAAGERSRALGFPPQVVPIEGSAALFRLSPSRDAIRVPFDSPALARSSDPCRHDLFLRRAHREWTSSEMECFRTLSRAWSQAARERMKHAEIGDRPCRQRDPEERAWQGREESELHGAIHLPGAGGIHAERKHRAPIERIVLERETLKTVAPNSQPAMFFPTTALCNAGPNGRVPLCTSRA